MQPNADEAKRALALAKRDFAGFIEGDQPNITENQFRWLSYRMSHRNDVDAMSVLLDDWEAQNEDSPAPINWTILEEWRQDPGFVAIEMTALGNKREGFRLLVVHLAGKALRQINKMLDSNDPKIVIRALTLWERTLGLLVDKLTIMDKDDLQRLAERLMKPVEITPIDGPSIVEGEFRDIQTKSPKLPLNDSD